MKPAHVYHFSEDPSIEVFRPRVAAGRPGTEALVWAIDEQHAPLYWFPRDCPRVTYWAAPDTDPAAAEAFLGTTAAKRVHAIECGWLESMRRVRLFVYCLDAGDFEPWPEADGHWVSRRTVPPLSVEPVGDLLARHAEAGIELRVTPSLWPLHRRIPSSGLRFSMVRMRNAVPEE